MEHSPLVEQKIMPQLPIIVPEDFKSQWVLGNMTNEEYHADRSAISSSALKLLVEKTPAHFKAAWMSGLVVDEEKDCFRYGSLAHCALLEPDRFKSQFVLEPKFEGFTKDGRLSTQSGEARRLKKEWYESLSPGSLVVTPDDHRRIMGSIASIIAHDKASKVLIGAKTEVSGYFRHPTTGIKCRLRPDILHLDKKVVIDFKTTRDASKKFFSSEIARRMYHLSMAFYGEGIKAIEGWEPEIYAFLAVEKDDPYACALYTLDRASIETAKAWVTNGMEILQRCLVSGLFPGIQSGLAEEISIPNWEHTRELPMFDFEEEELGQ